MIFKYEVLNPVIDKNKPIFNAKRNLLIFRLDKIYKYYVIVSSTNEFGNINYYILFSDIKFDDNCRPCRIDNYSRYKIYVNGKVKDFIIDELNYRANIELEYQETEGVYDIWKLT